MVQRGLLALTFGILALFAGSPLHADDMLMAVSGGETETLRLPTLVEDLEVSQTSASTSQPALDAPSDVVDPAVRFVEPGCCNRFAGTGCVPHGNSGCGSCYTVRFVPYGWLYEVYGDTTVRGLTAPVDITIRETLNILEHDVHFIFAGKLEVENDECGLIVNGFYLNAGFENRLRRLDFDSGFKMAIVDIAGTYNLASDPDLFSLPYVSRFDVLAGVRYWLLDASLTVTGPLGNSRSVSGDKEWVDPIIGGRIIVPLFEGAEGQLRGDVGGFDWGTASEFTWNLEALVAMRCCDCVSLRGGYRVLDVNNHRNSGASRFGFDVQFRGPVAEIAIDF